MLAWPPWRLTQSGGKRAAPSAEETRRKSSFDFAVAFLLLYVLRRWEGRYVTPKWAYHRPTITKAMR